MKKRRQRQSGQAMIEYILLLGLMVVFARFIFFSPEFGFNGLLNRGMLRLGSFLEQNLKTGTQPGPQGRATSEPFAGAANWNN